MIMKQIKYYMTSVNIQRVTAYWWVSTLSALYSCIEKNLIAEAVDFFLIFGYLYTGGTDCRTIREC